MATARITGGEEMFRLGRELKAKGPQGARFAREIQQVIEAESRKAVPDLRAAILSSRARGPRSSGLRRDLAAAVTVKAPRSEPSVRLMIDGSKMPDGKGRLPQYREGIRKRWRHPTFGNKSKTGWQDQKAKPVFYRRVRFKHKPAIDAAVQREAERLAQQLNRG